MHAHAFSTAILAGALGVAAPASAQTADCPAAILKEETGVVARFGAAVAERLYRLWAEQAPRCIPLAQGHLRVWKDGLAIQTDGAVRRRVVEAAARNLLLLQGNDPAWAIGGANAAEIEKALAAYPGSPLAAELARARATALADPALVAAGRVAGLSSEEMEIVSALDVANSQSALANGYKPYRDAVSAIYARQPGDDHRRRVRGAVCWHARWVAKARHPKEAPPEFLWKGMTPRNEERCPA
jgi:hypothetical protein